VQLTVLKSSKRDGSRRLCVHHSPLNLCTPDDIPESFNQICIQEPKIFGLLQFTQGFHKALMPGYLKDIIIQFHRPFWPPCPCVSYLSNMNYFLLSTSRLIPLFLIECCKYKCIFCCKWTLPVEYKYKFNALIRAYLDILCKLKYMT
jgi:hypothetical protein